jgi:hypothetical protein
LAVVFNGHFSDGKLKLPEEGLFPQLLEAIRTEAILLGATCNSALVFTPAKVLKNL